MKHRKVRSVAQQRRLQRLVFGENGKFILVRKRWFTDITTWPNGLYSRKPLCNVYAQNVDATTPIQKTRPLYSSRFLNWCYRIYTLCRDIKEQFVTVYTLWPDSNVWWFEEEMLSIYSKMPKLKFSIVDKLFANFNQNIELNLCNPTYI